MTKSACRTISIIAWCLFIPAVFFTFVVWVSVGSFFAFPLLLVDALLLLVAIGASKLGKELEEESHFTSIKLIELDKKFEQKIKENQKEIDSLKRKIKEIEKEQTP